MKIMNKLTMEAINKGLKEQGAVAGKLPNLRETNPTLAINKELAKMEEAREEAAVIIETEVVEDNGSVIAVATTNDTVTDDDVVVNVDDCVEIINESVEWVKDSFDLIYGTSYEGGIRYTEPLEEIELKII